MCGITGYWARNCDPRPWLQDLSASVDSLRQRGPDDGGTWVRPGAAVGFGHTRLSILDLSEGGHQPMVSRNGDYVMVFNGEVYNFAEVRRELEKLGHRFRSSGDSEIVLAALGEWGIAAVDRFIGMFAIALWQESTRRMWLIRDRMGVKPLYYAWDGKALWFGSELKALRAFGTWQPELDRDALAEYFQFGYISAPRSIYRRVHKLLPGHWLELGHTGEPVVRSYWSAMDRRETLQGTEDELERRLELLLIDAFRHRMVSDVPVGVFLSGGVDSSLVAALLQRHSGQTIHTFTIGFSDPRFDESRWARQVSAHLGTLHTEHVLSPMEGARILKRWPELFDEPFGDSSGVPTFLVSQVARETVKVALSADGGDELFSGYKHYSVMLQRQRALASVPKALRGALSHLMQVLPPASLQSLVERLPGPASLRHGARRGLIDRLEKLRTVLPEADPARMYDAGMSFWSEEESERLLGREIQPRRARYGAWSGFADHMSRSDIRHYLPDDILTKVDRTTMAVGLEGREPLLDHRIVEFALALPLHMRRGPLGTKHLLRRILYRYVPKSVLERPKQGFSMPISHWLRTDLSTLLDDYLAPERIREAGVLDPSTVEASLRNFREGGPNRDRLDVQKVWLLLAFEMWRDKWAAPQQRTSQVIPMDRKACASYM
jgi:asparagine synthase (glutamine-hydrolysing)